MKWFQDPIDRLICDDAGELFPYSIKRFEDEGCTPEEARLQAKHVMEKRIEEDRNVRAEFNDDPFFLCYKFVFSLDRGKELLTKLRSVGATDKEIVKVISRHRRQYGRSNALFAHLERYYTKVLNRRYWQEKLINPIIISTMTAVIGLVIGFFVRGCVKGI